MQTIQTNALHALPSSYTRRSLLLYYLFLGDVPHSGTLKDTLPSEPSTRQQIQQRSHATGDILRSFEDEHFETSSQAKHLPNDYLRNRIRHVAYGCCIHRNVPLRSNTML